MLSQKRFLWYYQMFPLRVSCSCQKLCNWNNLCDLRRFPEYIDTQDGTSNVVALSLLWTIGPHGCDSDRLGSREHSPVKTIWSTCLSEAFAAQTRSGQLPPASSMEQCAPGNTSQDRFTNKTWRMTKPHSSEPNTLYKVGNTGRNWVCSRSPISLDLALWHWTKLQGTSIIVLEVNSEWALEHGGCNGKRVPPTGPINECTVGSFCFVSPSYCPFRKSNLVLNSLYLFWNNLEFTVELYRWYRGIKKSRHI